MHADQPVSYSFYIARIIRSILVAMHADQPLIMIQIIAIVERYRTSYIDLTVVIPREPAPLAPW